METATTIPEFEVSVKPAIGETVRVVLPAENAATARMQVRRLVRGGAILGVRHLFDRHPDGRLTPASGRFVG